jgi:Glycosyl transferases group 1
MSGIDHSQICPKESAISVRSTPLRVAFSYNASRRHVTERYLSDTFLPGDAIHFDLDLFRPNVSLLQLLDTARSRDEAPDVFAHLVHTPGLPRDLHRSPIQTVSLDIDSFAWTSSRIRWSMLFDYVFVWHLSFVPVYQAAGHPKVFALPHCVDEGLFQASLSETRRPFDLGWVGAFDHAHYDKRRRIIQTLATRFKMNDFARRYSKQETADIYRQSKIVVNVSREDFPQEANMRCYEAMAGGALLVTGMPTELTEWGFHEGEHFVGWHAEAEIPDLVDYYLRHEQKSAEIARSGQELTLGDFTFQKCRDKMTSVFREHPNEFFAPARNWPDGEVHQIYLEYYYRYQLLEAALTEFSALRSFGGYWKGLPMILKTVRHRLKAMI